MKKCRIRRGGSFALKTLGCKTNRADSGKISARLHAAGWTPSVGNPTLCIVNSCCVTARSENKAFKAALAFKKANPLSEVVLSGCVADSLSAKAHEAGIEVKRKIPIPDGETEGRDIYPQGPFHRYFLKVQNGCDNFCAYCVVPILRGAPISFDKESIMRELDDLAGRFVLPGEIVLTGTNINLYKDSGSDIIDLIYAIRKKYSCRIRMSSLEPPFEKDFIKRLSGAGLICPHFPVPLQSGSDRILKKMGRKYDTFVFEKTLEEIRKYYDNPAITTDIIYGFPGETEKDFTATLHFMEKAAFSKSHVFHFSRRPGTLASLYQETPQVVMKERQKRIFAAAEQTAERYRKKFIGKKLEVVVENAPWQNVRSCKSAGADGGRAKAQRGEWFYGTSDNYLKVKFSAENMNVLPGDIVRVAADGIEQGIMQGIARETLWTIKAKK
ncbi:radical SAM protein [bacterium]|nr:radical SAM protein [bacterium]